MTELEIAALVQRVAKLERDVERLKKHRHRYRPCSSGSITSQPTNGPY